MRPYKTKYDLYLDKVVKGLNNSNRSSAIEELIIDIHYFGKWSWRLIDINKTNIKIYWFTNIIIEYLLKLLQD